MLLAVLSDASGQAPADTEVIDPPGRVGAISLLAGPVTLVDLSTGSREDALLNWPVTGGWRLETGRTGRAEVRIGSTALRLDDETTVDVVRLDDAVAQIAVLRGTVALRLRNREMLAELELLTQRERIAFDDFGRYRVDVDRTAGVTAVTAFTGRARIAAGGNTFVVDTGQRGEVTAPPLTRFQLLTAVPDRFDDWVAARDARDDSIRSATYVSREATGVELLDEYGDWRTFEDYGAVWFPRTVVTGWAPYRFGRWVWVSPWGWTWVDDAPWGFAPLHYGRWVVVGGAWGWVPGVIVPRPVYAPALVAWFGAPTIHRGAPVGWFPLGPREPYVPAHRHSPRYLRVVNVQNNVEQITIVQTPKYVHRHPDRSTWVPDDRFGRPEPVHRGLRPPPSEWRQYIARPQPPANVPDTKRRQEFDRAAPTLPSPAPGPIGEQRPAPRPPVAAPRAGDFPQSPAAPRAVEAPRVGDVSRSAPRAAEPSIAVEPPRAVERTGRPDVPGDRRMPPRSPLPSSQPAPVPQPSPAPRPIERPAVGTITVPQVQQPRLDVPTPAARGDSGPKATDGRRSAPRGPEAPTAPASPQPHAAPPAAEPSRAAPVVRPAPPSRDDAGEARGGQRPGRPPFEAAR